MKKGIKDKIQILPQGLPINFIETSQIPEFYVVNVANNQILYVSKSFEFVLAGEVIQLKEGQITSLNDKYQTKLIKISFQQLIVMKASILFQMKRSIN